MNINQSPHFKRSYQKLSLDIQKDFDEKIFLFIENPRHISLRTHKLKGHWGECFAFHLKSGNRVFFEFSEDKEVNLLEVGVHDLYRKRRK